MGAALTLVELSRVFQTLQPPLHHLLGAPTIVTDMGMAATLVERHENTLDISRAAAYDVKPGALCAMGLDVSCGFSSIDFSQSGALKVKVP
jgi:hypothetical protein